MMIRESLSSLLYIIRAKICYGNMSEESEHFSIRLVPVALTRFDVMAMGVSTKSARKEPYNCNSEALTDAERTKNQSPLRVIRSEIYRHLSKRARVLANYCR